MRLDDIAPSMEKMTDEELREHLRQIRHRRSVVRPAAKKIATKAAKKKTQKKMKKVEGLLDALTDEQKLALLKQLEGE